MDETTGYMDGLLRHERELADLDHKHNDHASDLNAHGDHSACIDGHESRLQTAEEKLAKIPDRLLDQLLSLPEDVINDIVELVSDLGEGAEGIVEGEDETNTAPVKGAVEMAVPDVEDVGKKAPAKSSTPKTSTPATRLLGHIGTAKRRKQRRAMREAGEK